MVSFNLLGKGELISKVILLPGASVPFCEAGVKSLQHPWSADRKFQGTNYSLCVCNRHYDSSLAYQPVQDSSIHSCILHEHLFEDIFISKAF